MIKKSAIALPTRAKAWQQTIARHDFQASPNAEAMFNTTKIKIAVDMAVADSGATCHFILSGTEVTNMKFSDNPLTINLPDGTQLKSTHTCEINVPWIPKSTRSVHIVPGMSHTSLVSIKV